MMARAATPPTAPPVIAPVFKDEDEEFDPGEPEVEEVVGVLDAFVALKKPWTAGSSNLVLPLLYRSSASFPTISADKTIWTLDLTYFALYQSLTTLGLW